ncbi:hypothetical protein BDW62DRAFT_82979 [Aspergillus aurantiobrunneus]
MEEIPDCPPGYRPISSTIASRVRLFLPGLRWMRSSALRLLFLKSPHRHSSVPIQSSNDQKDYTDMGCQRHSWHFILCRCGILTSIATLLAYAVVMCCCGLFISGKPPC